MLNWLNTNIGTDWATYAGVVLAIIPLIFGSNKLIARRRLSQSAKVKNGTVVQIGGSVDIKK